MVMVVYSHSSNFPKGMVIDSSIHTANLIIQNFISEGLNRSTVPFFFVISGYLFFVNIKKPSVKVFLTKIYSRFFTLAVPYIAWCIAAYFLAYAALKIPIVKPVVNQMGMDRTFKNLLFYIKFHPMPYQFWFLKDLIYITIFTPLIYILINKVGELTLLLATLPWLLIIKTAPFNINPVSIFFFSLAAYLAIKNIDDSKEIKNGTRLKILILWIVVLIINTYMKLSNNSILMTKVYIYSYRLGMIMGILALWFNYEKIFSVIIPFVKKYKLYKYSFFIYCFHEPIQDYIRYPLFVLSGYSEFAIFVMYPILPMLVIILGILIAKVLEKYIPTIYKSIT